MGSVDTDVIITDMDNDGVINITRKADAKGKDIVSAYPWNCGDGLNLGSIIIKNSEYGRAFIDRMIDSRVVWHQFYIGEQGAVWVLQTDDPIVEKQWMYARIRSINPRPAQSACTTNPKKMERVYWQEGDFVSHLAGIHNRTTLAQELLARSGFWPPTEQLDVYPAPFLQSPTTTHRDGLGTPFLLAKAQVLHVNRGKSALQAATHILVDGIRVPVTRYGAHAYSHDGNALKDERDEGNEDYALFRNDNNQWAHVVAVRNALADAQADSSKGDEWFIVASSLTEASDFVSRALKANVDEFARHVHVVVSRDDYGTPWLVRGSEFSRNLFLRLRDGNLLRTARRRVMHIPDGKDEEWGTRAPEGLKALVERNPGFVKPWVLIAGGNM